MATAGLILIASGLAIIGWGWWRFRRRSAASAAASTAWVRAEGTIRESSIKEEIEYDSDNDPVVHHAPAVSYSYDVRGESYAGSRAFFSRERFDNEDHAKAWLSGVRPGARVAVWHDPGDPARSVLEIDQPAKGELIGYIVAGVLLAGIGAMFFG